MQLPSEYNDPYRDQSGMPEELSGIIVGRYPELVTHILGGRHKHHRRKSHKQEKTHIGLSRRFKTIEILYRVAPGCILYKMVVWWIFIKCEALIWDKRLTSGAIFPDEYS